MNTTKTAGIGAVILAVIAFIGWLISWVMFTFLTLEPTTLKIAQILSAISTVTTILAAIVIAIGLISTREN
jgi:hypothetical protein